MGLKLGRFLGKALGAGASLIPGGGAVRLAADSIKVRKTQSHIFRAPDVQETTYYDHSNLPVPAGTIQLPALMGTACPVGHRMNKSTYITRGGGTSRWPTQLIVHPKGSTCVKRRRMNVANARALRRSIRRLRGFAKLARRAHAAVATFGRQHHQPRRLGRGAPGVEIVRTG